MSRPYLPTIISVTPSQGAGNYTYQWSSPAGNLGTDSLQNVVPATSTLYSVIVTDQCGNSVSEQVLYTITSPPLVLAMSAPALICPGDSTFISVTPTGGYGQFYYNWFATGETTQGIWVHPQETTYYSVSVSDECQTFTVEDSALVNVIHPTANFVISSHTLFESLPITFQNTSTGAVSYQWEFGDGNTSTMVHPNNTYLIPGTYEVTLIATNELGCKDTIQKPITIAEEYYIYVPNAFTPDGDRSNTYFSAVTVNISKLHVQIFNRWGAVIFESNDVRFSWDGTYGAKIVQDDVYVYKIEYITSGGIQDTIEGHVVVLK